MALALSGCWPGPEVGEELEELSPAPDVEGEVPDLTFAELQTTLFTPKCGNTYCHKGIPPPTAPMSMEPAVAYESLVGKPSTQVPRMMRVVPGDPAQSYLLLKLKGMAGSVGGTLSRMPLNKPALSAAQIAQVEAWIKRGAPND